MPFPFLSYGPLILLMDGLLLGVLLSLDREDATDTAAPSRWPTIVIQAGVCVVLCLFVFRLGLLVFGQHDIHERWQRTVEEARQREAEKREPVRGRILDSQNRTLAQQGTTHTLCADPSRLALSPDRHLLGALLRLVGMDDEMFAVRTADHTRIYVRLKRIDSETAEAVRRLNTQGYTSKTRRIESIPSRHPSRT